MTTQIQLNYDDMNLESIGNQLLNWATIHHSKKKTLLCVLSDEKEPDHTFCACQGNANIMVKGLLVLMIHNENLRNAIKTATERYESHDYEIDNNKIDTPYEKSDQG